jgi:acyl-CoA reductase-like NAD-dependent aldehyde dehydrogenase
MQKYSSSSQPIMEVEKQVHAACQASALWSQSTGAQRARLLKRLADGLVQNTARLVAMAHAETHLEDTRLFGELERTAYQLNTFADAAKAGEFNQHDVDAAVPGPPPAGHPRLMRIQVPVGPIAMFAASNFPFAFSVLGGDTASALAAGCPVVVRAHPGHTQLSAAVFEIAQVAQMDLSLPSGILGLVSEPSYETGAALVRHAGIQAVAFTGSMKGAQALMTHIQKRDQPIPFYGELGSVNPVVILPDALGAGLQLKAQELAASMRQGAGQFCTSPGLVLMIRGPDADAFVKALSENIDAGAMHRMLSPGIQSAYIVGKQRWDTNPHVQRKTQSDASKASQGYVGVTDGASYLAHPELHHEVFGTACLVILADNFRQLNHVLEKVGGSLTVTLWGANAETDDHKQLARTAARVAGRVLFAGVPTGVAITRWQHHGGPWPASTQPGYTSVGLDAANRFLRPVVLQDAPQWAEASHEIDSKIDSNREPECQPNSF